MEYKPVNLVFEETTSHEDIIRKIFAIGYHFNSEEEVINTVRAFKLTATVKESTDSVTVTIKKAIEVSNMVRPTREPFEPPQPEKADPEFKPSRG
jgi:hypothetical protein